MLNTKPAKRFRRSGDDFSVAVINGCGNGKTMNDFRQQRVKPFWAPFVLEFVSCHVVMTQVRSFRPRPRISHRSSYLVERNSQVCQPDNFCQIYFLAFGPGRRPKPNPFVTFELPQKISATVIAERTIESVRVCRVKILFLL